jgi:ferredoxin
VSLPRSLKMADFLHRHPLNSEGKFYVDHTCTDCDFCCVLAPNNFGRDPEKAHCFLLKLPTTVSELTEVREAVEGCPTNSISDDGDQFVWEDLPTQYSGWWSPCSKPKQASNP